MPAFLSDAIDVDAPDQALRLAAAERAAAMAVPSPESEVWRYSRIAELDLATYTPAAVRTTVTGADQVPAADAALVAQLVAGMAVHDVFDELNAAYHRTVAICVPAGKVLAEPIVVTHHIDGGSDGSGAPALYPRLVIHAGADSEFTVVERFESADDTRALVVPRLVVHAPQAARVSYLGINLLGTKVWQLGHQQATGERDSTTLLATVALGGDYARVRTDARGGPGRHHQAGGAVLRRRHADARLPHAARSHRSQDVQRSAVQGCSAGHGEERVHRAHPHP